MLPETNFLGGKFLCTPLYEECRKVNKNRLFTWTLARSILTIQMVIIPKAARIHRAIGKPCQVYTNQWLTTASVRGEVCNTTESLWLSQCSPGHMFSLSTMLLFKKPPQCLADHHGSRVTLVTAFLGHPLARVTRA